MGRYFFHVINGTTDLDLDGVELADIGKVRAEAVRAAGDMLCGDMHDWTAKGWHMSVVDSSDSVVFSMNFSVDRHGL